MVNEAFIAAVNRLLRNADWALDRLRPHAGKRARIAVGPLAVEFSVAPDGSLGAADMAIPVSVTVSVPPHEVGRWLGSRDAASRDFGVEGDAELASAISFVAANLRWDFEEDLSRLVGDIAAHRVGEAVRAMERWRRATANAAVTGIAEYLTEEKQVLPTRLRSESFMQEVEELRDAVERLEKRVARLEARTHR